MKIKELLLNEAILSPEDKAVDLEIKAIRKGKYASHPTKVRFGNYKIENGMVCIDDLSSLPWKLTSLTITSEGKLPFRFKRCGQILINTALLSSFDGFPEDISARGSTDYGMAAIIAITINERLTSLEGISKRIKGDLRLGMCHKIDWSNAHKYFEYIDGSVTISNQYNGPMLWALKIPKLHLVFYHKSFDMTDEQSTMMKILGKHLRGTRDIIACQRELIENDLDEYAEL